MQRRSLARAIGILVALVSVAWTNSSSASSPSLVSKPVFSPSEPLGTFIVGKRYTYSFCEPVTARACGGPFAKNQKNPTGGNGGPYIFKIKIGSGFAPTGIVLNSRTGILTGIATKKAAKNGEVTHYPFTVCVSDSSGETCNKYEIIVQPAPVVEVTVPIAVTTVPVPTGDFAGIWTGTYTRTTNDSAKCGKVEIPNRPAGLEITKSSLGFSVVISYSESGVRICQGSLGENGRIRLNMKPTSPTIISGDADGQVFTFELTGTNTISGTGAGWWGTVKATFNRG